jgi:hypothetical protein
MNDDYKNWKFCKLVGERIHCEADCNKCPRRGQTMFETLTDAALIAATAALADEPIPTKICCDCLREFTPNANMVDRQRRCPTCARLYAESGTHCHDNDTCGHIGIHQGHLARRMG